MSALRFQVDLAGTTIEGEKFRTVSTIEIPDPARITAGLLEEVDDLLEEGELSVLTIRRLRLRQAQPEPAPGAKEK